LVVTIVASPITTEEGDGPLLERALAAVSTDRVLYAVFEAASPGALVDLDSGARRPLRAYRAMWFDPERGLRTSLRVEGAGPPQRVGELDLDPLGREERALYEALTADYRYALEHGLAQVVGSAKLGARDVAWVRIASEQTVTDADLSDLDLSELAVEAAVDRNTYAPVAVRRTLDGEPTGATVSVLRAEAVAPEAVPLTAVRVYDEALGYDESIERDLSLGRASGRLPGALWAGRAVAGLPFSRVDGRDFEQGRGHFRNWDVVRGLDVLYGSFDRHGNPSPGAPFVRVRQTLGRVVWMPAYRPPDGTVVTGGGRRGAYLVRDGVHVWIEASDDDLALAAARALRPIGR